MVVLPLKREEFLKMGYDIVYKRQFVKVKYRGKEQIIPLLYTSDNYIGLSAPKQGTNAHMVTKRDKEGRLRSWGTLGMGNQISKLPITTEDALLNHISFVAGISKGEFSYRNERLKGKRLIDFYKRGIKAAKTLEEMNGISQIPVKLRGYLMEYEERPNGTYEREVGGIDISNSKELVKFLQKCEETVERYERQTVKDRSIYVHIGFYESRPIKKPQRAVREKKNILSCI